MGKIDWLEPNLFSFSLGKTNNKPLSQTIGHRQKLT